MIQIISDWSAVDRELDRLEALPSRRDKQVFDAVLSVGFAQTQAAVHTESGALKASGRQSSEVDRASHQWEGEISYGDDSGPVDYAIYEKRRGAHWAGDSAAKGDHDFMRPLEDLHAAWVGAMMVALRK